MVSLDLPDTGAQDWQGLVSDEVRRPCSGIANDHFAVVRDALGCWC